MTKFKTSIVLGTIISLLLIIVVSCATEDIGLIEQQKQLPLNQNTEEVSVVEETNLVLPEQQSDLALKTNLQEFARKYVRYTTMIQNRLARSKVGYAELKQSLSGIKTQNDLKIALEKVGIKDSVGVIDLTIKATNLAKDFLANNPRFSKYSITEKQNLLTIELQNAFEERRKEKLKTRFLKTSIVSRLEEDPATDCAQDYSDTYGRCDRDLALCTGGATALFMLTVEFGPEGIRSLFSSSIPL
ncbi:hypothetical protein [Flavobacterium daejeonense]|uniref:hypothetical protein n=1 Tax=Flavobacterium daejeonense TaxID=350893 RepID=UPI0004789821|nr:hypothetical protein [Flavobacterium daejeonense]